MTREYAAHDFGTGDGDNAIEWIVSSCVRK